MTSEVSVCVLAVVRSIYVLLPMCISFSGPISGACHRPDVMPLNVLCKWCCATVHRMLLYFLYGKMYLPIRYVIATILGELYICNQTPVMADLIA